MSSSGLVTSAISNESTKEPKERLLGHGESLTAPDVVVVVTVPNVVDGGHRRNIGGSSSACTLVSKQNDLC